MIFYDLFLDFSRSLTEILGNLKVEDDVAEINAGNLNHKELNDLISYAAFEEDCRVIRIFNVFGQRYIGTRLFSRDQKKLQIEIYGFPGNDLGAFLSGHRIVVYGNAQDGVGNTMDDGEIVIHGRAGDVVAMSMRGGRIMIRDNTGYRTAIHMKEYKEKVPVVIIGGTSQDFLGEYMAGGRVVLLGVNRIDKPHSARYVGAGMHGGIIYIRGKIERWQVSREVEIAELDSEDYKFLEKNVGDFCREFGFNADELLGCKFSKLLPSTKRPYGKIYTI